VISVPGKSEVYVTPKFGPGDVPCKDGEGKTLTPEQCRDPATKGTVFVPDPASGTNCDFDDDGRINFDKGTPEEKCATSCTSDPECTEYSNFIGRSSFRITVKNLETGRISAVQADSTTSAAFKPLDEKGKPLKAFSGTLHFFSGGAQYTIEARCKDDIVTDLQAQPLPSDKACVFPRTFSEEAPQ
jgi:hypothetical protein